MKTDKRHFITELGPALMISQKIMICQYMPLKMLSMSFWMRGETISIFTSKLDYIYLLLRSLSCVVQIILGGIKDIGRIRLVCKRFRTRYNNSKYQFDFY